MKKMYTKLCLSTLLLVLAAGTAGAQEIHYALPATTLVVKVDVQQEQFFAGPYASFAKRMLNMDVRREDGVSSTLVVAEIIPTVEADPKAWYTCAPGDAALLALSSQGLISTGGNAASAEWRFPAPVQADFSENTLTGRKKTVTRIEYRKSISEEGDTLHIPVEHRVSADKSLEDKAAEAADMILSIRKDRLNIASGNTDASFSGEAMAAALQELDRMEKEYLALFRGYSVKSSCSAVFELTPDPARKTQRYLLFRLTDQGPVAVGGQGVPYYIELEAEALELPYAENKKENKKVKPLHYRIPATCKVYLTQDGRQLLQTRLPVYQLGTEATYYSTAK